MNALFKQNFIAPDPLFMRNFVIISPPFKQNFRTRVCSQSLSRESHSSFFLFRRIIIALAAIRLFTIHAFYELRVVVVPLIATQADCKYAEY